MKEIDVDPIEDIRMSPFGGCRHRHSHEIPQNPKLFEILLCARNLEIRQDLKPVQIQQDQKAGPLRENPKLSQFRKPQSLS